MQRHGQLVRGHIALICHVALNLGPTHRGTFTDEKIGPTHVEANGVSRFFVQPQIVTDLPDPPVIMGHMRLP